MDHSNGGGGNKTSYQEKTGNWNRYLIMSISSNKKMSFITRSENSYGGTEKGTSWFIDIAECGKTGEFLH